MEAMAEITRAARDVVRPLDDAEADRARALALATLAERVEGLKAVVHDVGLRIGKPARGKVPTRAVGVIVSDRRLGRVWDVVTTDGTDVEVNERPGYQPPFLDEEIDEARRIAEEGTDVGRGDGVGVLPFFPGSPDGRRRVGLNYVRSRGDGSVVGTATVVVDLVAGRVDRYQGRG